MEEDQDEELQAQLTILAASKHDLESLRTLLRTGSASVQDPETGFTPLHAAIAACEDIEDTDQFDTNGRLSEKDYPGNGKDRLSGSAIDGATRTLQLLLQNGAIWNDIDKHNETPGCLALRLGLGSLYEIMMNAGVRAEMLLNRLDEYQMLTDDDSNEDEAEAMDEDAVVIKPSDDEEIEGRSPRPNIDEASPQITSSPDIDNINYLQSTLRFQDDRILDDDKNGVMMAWESDIMKRTAQRLVSSERLRILNIGHGMGIIDTFFQDKAPSIHHIIEAHPGVLARMKDQGWKERTSVTIHEGRWQDIIPEIISTGLMFDAIYFDTFAEDYNALRDFFSESVVGLLDDGGKWGFFNGLGADRQICYDVYTKLVEMDLFEAGFDTEWESIKTPDMSEEEWKGVRRKYWALKEYRLPICTFT